LPITQLYIQNFRNFDELDWEPSANLNVLEGENAQGKTNLIEAVYYLINGRSFRTQESTSLIRFERGEARIQASLAHEDLSSRLEINLNHQGRSASLQGKTLANLGKVHTLIRALIFTPDSSVLFRGSPGGRRRYFDHAISVHRAGYTETLSRYQRVLKQRNQLLEREAPLDLLEGFDLQWAEMASQVMQEREAYLEELLPPWRQRLELLTEGRCSLRAKWEGRLWRTEIPKLEEILSLLRETREEEKRSRRSVLGPQRDDLGVYFDGHPVREMASQGQQRMLVIALKLAEADLFRLRTERSPVFLLDDLGSELDHSHLDRLLGMLGEIHAQTFLTTAQRGTYSLLKAKTFRVREGRLLAI
jgi:DNA replication and repair protein RecF